MRWALVHPEIGYVLLNTNGLKLAADGELVAALASLHDRYKGFEIYLQFDGWNGSAQKILRGTDLSKKKMAILDLLSETGLPVTLAMTVIPENLAECAEVVSYGVRQTCVRGVSFQPMFESGRCIESGRVTAADIIHTLTDPNGMLSERDFTPLPCGDPNCHIVSYLLRDEERVTSLSYLSDLPALQGFLADRVNYRLEDLARCGCETEPLGQLLHEMELSEDSVFRIVIKPFMDACNYDQHRVDRCCTHVILEDGRLDSFCHHYAVRK